MGDRNSENNVWNGRIPQKNESNSNELGIVLKDLEEYFFDQEKNLTKNANLKQAYSNMKMPFNNPNAAIPYEFDHINNLAYQAYNTNNPIINSGTNFPPPANYPNLPLNPNGIPNPNVPLINQRFNNQNTNIHPSVSSILPNLPINGLPGHANGFNPFGLVPHRLPDSPPDSRTDPNSPPDGKSVGHQSLPYHYNPSTVMSQELPLIDLQTIDTQINNFPEPGSTILNKSDPLMNNCKFPNSLITKNPYQDSHDFDQFDSYNFQLDMNGVKDCLIPTTDRCGKNKTAIINEAFNDKSLQTVPQNDKTMYPALNMVSPPESIVSNLNSNIDSVAFNTNKRKLNESQILTSGTNKQSKNEHVKEKNSNCLVSNSVSCNNINVMPSCVVSEDKSEINAGDDDGIFQNIKWHPFKPANWCSLYSEQHNALLTPSFSVTADKGFNYSLADESFVCQKKNHFQITLDVALQGSPKYVRTPDGSLRPILSYYAHFYGVKAESTTQIIKVEESQSDRSKKAFNPVQLNLLPDKVMKYTVGRLHFGETTINNMRKKGKPNPDQRYFLLIVSLCARIDNPSAKQPFQDVMITAFASEKIIVRASNPGQFDNDPDSTWQKGQGCDSVFHMGHVGINTDTPDESLVVHGNIKVTGHILQPSDERIKTNIVELDTKKQLQNVSRIKLYHYRYDVSKLGGAIMTEGDTLSDTGVLAQEIEKVLPEAVKKTTGWQLPNGETIPDFRIVNKDRIFMENVGAVKELTKVTGTLGNRIEKLEKINKIFPKRAKDLLRESFRSISGFSNSLSYTSSITFHSTSTKSKKVQDLYNKILQDQTSVSQQGHISSPPHVKKMFKNRFVQYSCAFITLVLGLCLLTMSTLFVLEYIHRHKSTSFITNKTTPGISSANPIINFEKKLSSIHLSPRPLVYETSSQNYAYLKWENPRRDKTKPTIKPMMQYTENDIQIVNINTRYKSKSTTNLIRLFTTQIRPKTLSPKNSFVTSAIFESNTSIPDTTLEKNKIGNQMSTTIISPIKNSDISLTTLSEVTTPKTKDKPLQFTTQTSFVRLKDDLEPIILPAHLLACIKQHQAICPQFCCDNASETYFIKPGRMPRFHKPLLDGQKSSSITTKTSISTIQPHMNLHYSMQKITVNKNKNRSSMKFKRSKSTTVPSLNNNINNLLGNEDILIDNSLDYTTPSSTEVSLDWYTVTKSHYVSPNNVSLTTIIHNKSAYLASTKNTNNFDYSVQSRSPFTIISVLPAHKAKPSSPLYHQVTFGPKKLSKRKYGSYNEFSNLTLAHTTAFWKIKPSLTNINQPTLYNLNVNDPSIRDENDYLFVPDENGDSWIPVIYTAEKLDSNSSNSNQSMLEQDLISILLNNDKKNRQNDNLTLHNLSSSSPNKLYEKPYIRHHHSHIHRSHKHHNRHNRHRHHKRNKRSHNRRIKRSFWQLTNLELFHPKKFRRSPTQASMQMNPITNIAMLEIGQNLLFNQEKLENRGNRIDFDAQIPLSYPFLPMTLEFDYPQNEYEMTFCSANFSVSPCKPKETKPTILVSKNFLWRLPVGQYAWSSYLFVLQSKSQKPNTTICQNIDQYQSGAYFIHLHFRRQGCKHR